MTREEAIRWINEEIRWENECQSKHPIKEALYAARKALEQEPYKPMVEIDLYSVIKQSYIEREVLDKIRAEIVKKHLSVIEKNDFESGRTYGYEEVLEILDKYKTESEGV